LEVENQGTQKSTAKSINVIGELKLFRLGTPQIMFNQMR
jgi:hypothetical protein